MAKAITIAAALLVVTFLVIGRSRSAFSDQVDNTPNKVSTGNIVLLANDSGTQMFNDVTALVPGAQVVRCIQVTYDGTIDPNEVRLYGAVDGGVSNGLEDHVDITVEQGDWNGNPDPGYPACTNFSNATTIFAADTITAFTTANYDYAHAVAGWNPASQGEFRVYRVTLDVLGTAAENTTAQFTLTWEVQS